MAKVVTLHGGNIRRANKDLAKVCDLLRADLVSELIARQMYIDADAMYMLLTSIGTHSLSLTSVTFENVHVTRGALTNVWQLLTNVVERVPNLDVLKIRGLDTANADYAPVLKMIEARPRKLSHLSLYFGANVSGYMKIESRNPSERTLSHSIAIRMISENRAPRELVMDFSKDCAQDLLAAMLNSTVLLSSSSITHCSTCSRGHAWGSSRETPSKDVTWCSIDSLCRRNQLMTWRATHLRAYRVISALLPLRLNIWSVLAILDWIPTTSIRLADGRDVNALKKLRLLESTTRSYEAIIARRA
jgi:hypothetical protein